MKNKKFLLFGTLLMVVFATIVTVSCNKKFDEPPVASLIPVDTSITNHIISIRDLKAKHSIGGFEQITDNSIIAVVVGADDEAGNFYKSLAVQDSTGGILLKLDRSNLYTDYPTGRKLYIKCKGLYISDYNHSIDLGMIDNSVPGNPALGGIPSVFFDTYIIKGTLGNTVTPKLVTLAQLNSVVKIAVGSIPSKDSLQNVLVQINNVELATSDIGYIYSDTSAAKKSVSRNLTDCIGTTGVVLYTSGYAQFAGLQIPTGKGTLTGIFTPYSNKSAEIFIRDTSDVKFNDIRCGAAVATTLFSETFPGITNKAAITTTGSSNVWQNIAEVGGVSYVGFVSGATHLASISSFGNSAPVVTSWLITQAITIPSGANTPTLSFDTKDGYDKGSTFQCLVSTNYNGNSTPSTSTWTPLPMAMPASSASGYSASASSSIDLSAYIGKTIYLSWRYDGTDVKTTTYEFGNVKLIYY